MKLISLLFFLHLYNFCFARDFSIRSDQDLLTAINNVRPGDIIHLYGDTVYYLQNVELTRSGLPNLPITLNGDKGTKITSDNTGLVIRGSYWKIQNIAFENSQSGILVLGNNNTLKSLSFLEIEEEGLVLRGNGNLVKNSVFNAASHGIVVSGRDNILSKNSITCMVTSVTATPRSCCNRLESNVFNGLLNVLGGEYSIIKNVANSDVSVAGQRNNLAGNVINGRLDVSGCGNTFQGNTAGVSDFTSTCYNWDDGDNHFGGTLGAVVSDTTGSGKPGQPGVSSYPGWNGNQKPNRPGNGNNHNHNHNNRPGQPGQPGASSYPSGNYQKPGQGQPGQPGASSYPNGNYNRPGQPGRPGNGHYQTGQPGQPGGTGGGGGGGRPGRPGNWNGNQNGQPGSPGVVVYPGNNYYPQSNANKPSVYLDDFDKI